MARPTRSTPTPTCRCCTLCATMSALITRILAAGWRNAVPAERLIQQLSNKGIAECQPRRCSAGNRPSRTRTTGAQSQAPPGACRGGRKRDTSDGYLSYRLSDSRGCGSSARPAPCGDIELASRRATDAQVLADAERLIRAWNKRQARRMPMLFAPTIGAALTSQHHFLLVYCPACRTPRLFRVLCFCGRNRIGRCANVPGYVAQLARLSRVLCFCGRNRIGRRGDRSVRLGR